MSEPGISTFFLFLANDANTPSKHKGKYPQHQLGTQNKLRLIVN